MLLRATAAAVGQRLSDVLTPCLLLALPALERNDNAMTKALDGTGIALRPHFKAHKSSSLASWQMSRGSASSYCAQTISEANCLVRGAGCHDVILTNSAAPASVAHHLAEIAAEHPDAVLAALVDCPEHVRWLAEASRARGVKLGALVEIECGQDRGGCAAGSSAALALARSIIAEAALEWRGLHVYHGVIPGRGSNAHPARAWLDGHRITTHLTRGSSQAIQHVPTDQERREAVEAGPAAAARATIALLASAGIGVPLITGGGTGTLTHDVAAGSHTEVQPGSYLLMDRQYGAIETACHFEQALYVHTTVTSADDGSGKRIVDAGAKAVDMVSYQSGGDNHGILRGVPTGTLPVGSTLQLIPSHCDPTVNLHDFFVVMRGLQVEHVWDIDARGPG